ncbi:MAG TPA: hypothetical protein VGO79_15895 [Thermoanaerobaculia bacterium]|jgi:hypothetical protein
MGPVVYTAVECSNPETRADWSTFVAWSRLTQLREVVSLDFLLCPNAFQELAAEDWEHNVHEDFKTHLFRDADYVSRRVTGKAMTVLALIEEPSDAEVASFRDPRFAFCGFDLVDEQGGGISALTNCGGFDRAFLPAELTECGLLLDPSRARAVRELLRTEYPDEPHARCRIWAIWRMKK